MINHRLITPRHIEQQQCVIDLQAGKSDHMNRARRASLQSFFQVFRHPLLPCS